jgi:phenylalanyl-tRNA synthetase beta chain
MPREEIRLAAAFTGAAEPPHWSAPSRPWDVWALKGLLAELARELGADPPRAGAAGEAGVIDPEERFTVGAGAGPLGEGGRVLAGAVDSPAWADPVFGLELTLHADARRGEVAYAPLPDFPAVERDLALLVPLATPASEVERVIRAAAGELLEAVWPFDLYTGPGIAAGTRSLAWRLRWRAADRTLTDAEVDRAVERVLRALGDELDVVRR